MRVVPIAASLAALLLVAEARADDEAMARAAWPAPNGRSFAFLAGGVCLAPIAHFDAPQNPRNGPRAPWSDGFMCGARADSALALSVSRDASMGLWFAFDAGVATGSLANGARWGAADAGATLGFSYDRRWISLRAGIPLRAMQASVTNCGPGKPVVCSPDPPTVGLDHQIVPQIPLGKGWVVAAPLELRLLPFYPGVLEVGGGLELGKRF